MTAPRDHGRTSTSTTPRLQTRGEVAGGLFPTHAPFHLIPDEKRNRADLVIYVAKLTTHELVRKVKEKFPMAKALLTDAIVRELHEHAERLWREEVEV